MRYLFRTLLLLMPLLMTLPSWAEEEGDETKKVASQYISLKPSFVVSLGTRSYLKADASLRVRGDETVKKIEHHMPLIRDSLVLLFSSQAYTDVEGAEGREALRKTALQMLQQTLTEETGKPLVDDLLFTSFVLQR
ncbi:flagellar basal body-associated FliL family protein [Aestuariirhabdus sp. Z084]|uniref:flagellar basal body-associated FliL family protein n=1 Tax=Aestuariirhabdus haliotis TaxID=2918751 RepID=UPI00201B3EC3|nr:flagellar basal body-associated FliL family protein [Aestuariirhabdus haliotis]MCL6414380.1 flagellar basal body-associated FliL family protein [Aestuariirhabdus haliotis]MCL6418312.1 flagellar basal body-associated FliL family protein [Aestuariirhabdus haliotis]